MASTVYWVLNRSKADVKKGDEVALGPQSPHTGQRTTLNPWRDNIGVFGVALQNIKQNEVGRVRQL